MQWFYVNAGQQVGPADDKTIDILISNGVISAATLVWREGWPEWRPAAETEMAGRLAGRAATPGSPPPPLSSAAGGKARTLAWLWFSFGGRATRKDYWLRFVLPYLALAFAAGILDGALGTFDPDTGFGPAIAVYYLAALWPSLAVLVKRWHDRDRSGWFVLVVFVPVIGSIWTFVECGCLRGTIGANRFGADPLDPSR